MSSRPSADSSAPEKRLLIVNNSLFHGGVEQQIAYTKRELERRGWQVFFVYFNRGNRGQVRGGEYEYIPWKRYFTRSPLKALHLLPFLLKTVRYARQKRVRLIHTYGPYENLAGAITARLLGIRHVASVRTNRAWAFKFIRIWGPLSWRVLTNAESIRAALAGSYRLDPEKLRVIRNGIDIGRFPFLDKGDLDKPSLTVGIVGRISTSKNQLFFLRHFSRWHQERGMDFRYRVELIGSVEDENYYRSLRAFLQQAGLESRVAFIPWTPDITARYREIDLIALPSISEGLPNVLLEAAAAGIPWTAARVADVGYLAQACGYGDFLFEPDSPKSLYRALDALFAESGEELQRWVRDARSFAESAFSLEKLGERTEALYLE